MNWQVNRDVAADGPTNMAADLAIFDAANDGCSTIRFYSWNGPWVTLGKFQKPEADLIDFTSIPWVIRPTGGKAVLHGHDLTIAIACPVTADSVRAVYRRLIGPIAQGMQIAGQAAVLGEETLFVGHGGTADCFRNVSANDIVDPATGRKLVGCALKLTRTAALAQCSIPLGTPLVDPANIYRHPHTAMPLDIAESSLVKGITEAFTRIEIAAGGS